MATINTARYFGLKNIGAIDPGFKADFILLDNLESFKIFQVFLDGKKIDTSSESIKAVKNRKTSHIHTNDTFSTSSSSVPQNTMHIKSLDHPNMFSISGKSNGKSSLLQVIGIIPGQIITQKRIIIPKIDENNRVIADAQRDIAKLAVIERHHRTGHFGLGFVQGLGLKRGAIASSVAHDSHNLVVAGMNDMDMLIAAKHISLIGGGLL